MQDTLEIEGKELGVVGKSTTPNFYKVLINDKQVTISQNEGIHFNKIVLLGSKKIQIKVVEKFNILPKTPEAKSVRDEVNKKIGSQWKLGTRDIIRGLPSKEEEVAYMPLYIGVSPTNDRWEEKLLNHWANFGIYVPNNEQGTEIEAGFKIINEQTREAAPIDLEGYMKYNFCIANSKVAKIGEDNLITFDFILVDKSKELMERREIFTKSKDIEVKYLKLIRSTDLKDRNKIDWLLETYGGPNGLGINTRGMDNIAKEMAIEELKKKDLLKFDKYLNDPYIELKSFIRKCLSFGLLTLEGNTYFMDTKAVGDLAGTIGYLSDPANNGDRLKLTERLNAALI